MNKYAPFFLILTALAITSCATLPKDRSVGGVVVLPLEFVNNTSFSEPAHKIDLIYQDGTTRNFVPRNGSLVLIGTNPATRIKAIRASLRLEGWHGSDSIQEFDIPVEFETGKLKILPFTFRYAFWKDPAQMGYRYDWTFVPLSAETAETVRARLQSDPNYPVWQD